MADAPPPLQFNSDSSSSDEGSEEDEAPRRTPPRGPPSPVRRVIASRDRSSRTISPARRLQAPESPRGGSLLLSPARVAGAVSRVRRSSVARLQAVRARLAGRRAEGREKKLFSRCALKPLGPLLVFNPDTMVLLENVVGAGASDHTRHSVFRTFREAGALLSSRMSFRLFDLGFALNARSVLGTDVLIPTSFGGEENLQLFPGEPTPLPSVAALFGACGAVADWLAGDEGRVAVLLARNAGTLAVFAACALLFAGHCEHADDGLELYHQQILARAAPPPRSQALLAATVTEVRCQVRHVDELAAAPQLTIRSIRLSGPADLGLHPGARNGFRPYVMVLTSGAAGSGVGSQVVYSSLMRGVQTYGRSDGPIVFAAGCKVRGDVSVRAYHVPPGDAGQMQFQLSMHSATLRPTEDGAQVVAVFGKADISDIADNASYPDDFTVEVLFAAAGGDDDDDTEQGETQLKCRNLRCGALFAPPADADRAECPRCGAAMAVPLVVAVGAHERAVRGTQPMSEDDPRLAETDPEAARRQRRDARRRERLHRHDTGLLDLPPPPGADTDAITDAAQPPPPPAPEPDLEGGMRVDEAVAHIVSMFPERDVAFVERMVQRAARRNRPLEWVVEQLVMVAPPEALGPQLEPGAAVVTPYGAGLLLEVRGETRVVQLPYGVGFFPGTSALRPPELPAGAADTDELLARQLQEAFELELRPDGDGEGGGGGGDGRRGDGELLDELMHVQGGVDYDDLSYEQLLRLDEGGSGGGSRRRQRAGRSSRRRREREEAPFHPRGASGQEIRELPTYEHSGGPKAGSECMVCQYPFADGELLRMLPCIHAYHAECIDPWLQRNKACPMCQRRIDDRGDL